MNHIAQARISTLLDQIGEQLKAIDSNDSSSVDGVIAEQDKSSFITKQSELIDAFISRENYDERDAYIAELEAQIKKAKSQEEYYSNQWYKERQNTKCLKDALKSLTQVLTEE